MLRQYNGIARFIFEALGVLIVVRLSAQTTGDPRASFINWETPPVHPLALSPDGQRLVICNLPDSRLEVFSLQTGIPENQGNVVVGLDPVSVRFRTTNEVWVVNHISSSVSVVDLGELRVVATIQTLPGSADVVFAGTPTRAFVSCSKVNTVQILDPVTRSVISNVVLNAERPKALATSPDGRKVYAAVFESGNGSTILGPKLTTFPIRPPPGVVGATNGPYGGRNPPPNHGTEFYPAINTNTLPPPAVSLIVKKNNARRWMDDNGQDWTGFVSGTNATISGRVQGWDLP